MPAGSVQVFDQAPTNSPQPDSTSPGGASPSDVGRAATSVASTARVLIAELQNPRPAIYWTDLLVTLLVGYGSAAVYLGIPEYLWFPEFGGARFSGWGSPIWRLVAFLVAGAALYRAALFVHEIVHFHPRQMELFSAAWNGLVGVPLLIPSFLYESHRSHHNTHEYGTERDGEYLPFGKSPRQQIAWFLLQIFVQPLFILCRFAVLAPLSHLDRRLRRWTLERASSLVIDFRYRRAGFGAVPSSRVVVLESVCCVWANTVAVLVVTGVIPWFWLPQVYLLAAFGVLLNHLRTLAAHRYLSDGEAMSFDEQLGDSTTIAGGGLWTAVLCPLGLRYHALHHLFPRLPYHNLGAAHRRLWSGLPDDSPYRATVYASWFAVIRELLAHAGNVPLRRQP